MSILLVVATPVAFAQTTSDEVTVPGKGPIAAPQNAFELGVEGGYTQPFGEVTEGLNVGDIADAGGAIGLLLGWRISPHWGLGLTGQYHQNTPDDKLANDTSVFGATGGIEGSFHMRPYEVVDPYATLGTGYRGLFMQAVGSTPDINLHGWEIAKLQLGLDFRTSNDIAVGPVIGADVNTFLATDNTTIDNPSVNTFIYVGANARFDVGGSRVGGPRRVAVVRPAPAPTPAAAPAEVRPVVPETPPEPPATPTECAINIDEAIIKECGIAAPKAYFKFDSANLQANDSSTLDAVAACFATGPLKDRKMQIVGHADPRGTDNYNMVLGESRADTVSKYMSTHGVVKTNLIEFSRGERDATGTDENGWAYDRRVDVRLDR